MIHYAAQQLPQLAVLPGPLELSQLLQTGGALLQLPGQPQFLQKIPQYPQLLRRALALLQPAGQTAQGAGHPAADGVDFRQCLCLGGGEFLPPAVRVGGPVLLPDPHGAVDIPGNDVVLQLVAFLVCDPRQAGFQPAEHILVFVSPRNRIQRPRQQAQRRLFQYIAAAAEIDGDVKALKHVFNRGGIFVQVPRRHGNVPITAVCSPYQLPYLGGGVLRLREHALRLHQLHSGAVPLPGRYGAEEPLRQMLQTGFRNLGRQSLHPAWHTAGRRQPFQAALGPDALLEHFQLTAVPQQRHRH